MHNISLDKRRLLKEKIINGAQEYNAHLINKDFLIVCEDGYTDVVRFFKRDFLHLTGVSTNLNEESFYDNCVRRKLDVSNIKEKQKYNWNTLKSKAVRIEKIHKIIYADVQESLFMINLHTESTDFPVAIRNKSIATCVGFKEIINKARTLRKYDNSSNADEQKRIIAIFEKKQTDSLYSDLVYVSTVEELYDKKSDINSLLTEDLKKMIVANLHPRLGKYTRITINSVMEIAKLPKCFRTDTYSEKLKQIKLKNRMR